MINRIHARFPQGAPTLEEVRDRLALRTGLPVKLALIDGRDGATGGELSSPPFSRTVNTGRDGNKITVYDLPPTRRWSYLEWVLLDVLRELGADVAPPRQIPSWARSKWSERRWWHKLFN